MTSTSKAKTEHIEEALKPCPFCGSVNVDPTGWASIESAGPACDNCGASAGKVSKSVEENVAAWNLRTDQRKDREEGEGYIDGDSGQYVGPFRECSCGGTELELKGKFWCCKQCGVSYGEHAGPPASPPPASPAVTVGVKGLAIGVASLMAKDVCEAITGKRDHAKYEAVATYLYNCLTQGLASQMVDLAASPPGETAQVEAGLFWRWESEDKWRMLGTLSDAALADFVRDQEKIAPIVTARLYLSASSLSAKESPEQLRERGGHVQYRLKWRAAARPPVHPEAMEGLRTFGTLDASVRFMSQQAADAELISLTEIRSSPPVDVTDALIRALPLSTGGGQ